MEVRINFSGKVLNITDKIDCKTRFFLYHIFKSNKNTKQYGGQSALPVARRALQHANIGTTGRRLCMAWEWENQEFTLIKIIRSGNL